MPTLPQIIQYKSLSIISPDPSGSAGKMINDDLIVIADHLEALQTSVSGYSGMQATSGYSGYSGKSGISGYSGYAGNSGFSGYSGLSGTPGASGGTGASGSPGSAGAPGASGAVGAPGSSGYSGNSGRSGYSGYSGLTGTSIAAGTIAYSAVVTPNADSYTTLNIGTLTGNLTIANPTGTPVDGQNLMIVLTQDSSGGHTVSWDTAFAFGSDILSADIPTTLSKSCVVGTKYHQGTGKWRIISLAKGF